MKLVFNLVLGLHRAALAEGLTFAEAYRPEDALAVLRAGLFTRHGHQGREDAHGRLHP